QPNLPIGYGLSFGKLIFERVLFLYQFSLISPQKGRLKSFQTAFAKAIKKGCRSSLFEQMFAD
ncbi:MAG: hypothetical protein KBG52_07115, partial [Neisseria sp.]|nr:hypothetical protein [Neisseria sp.]